MSFSPGTSSKRIARALRGVLVAVTLVGSLGHAQLPVDQNQALQMFRAMSPAQQQEILRTLQQESGIRTTSPQASAFDQQRGRPEKPGDEQTETGATVDGDGQQPDLQDMQPTAAPAQSTIERRFNRASEVPSLAVTSTPRGTGGKLKQFGYDLFDDVPTTFAPATDIPVPVDYIVGPGDTVEIQLFGNQNAQYSLVVTREGVLNFPGLGPINVAGQRFAELKANLDNRIAKQMIGVQASVTMGALRSIRVFVLGDVERPGSYTVSALSTVTNALFASGGIRPIGSLRDVQLKRNGKIVTRLDLYDLLLNGDTRADARLQPGDVIFVPPIGPTVGVAGEVRRPAIYELRETADVARLVELAGGLLPSARADSAQLERVASSGGRTLLDVDVASTAGRAVPVQDGDVLRVYSVIEKLDNIVLLEGHVQRPGGYQWREGMRLSNLLPSVDSLLPSPDVDYVMIVRELGPGRQLQVQSAELDLALLAPGGDNDPLLNPRDRVIVFGLATPRDEQIAPVIEQLRLQARRSNPEQVVTVHGQVPFPGDYPLEPGMRVSDLIRAGGGFKQQAYTLQAELTRYIVEDGRRIATTVDLDLAAARAGDPEANIELQSFDSLQLKPIPDWHVQETIEIAGEVRFPGTYTIRAGETLQQVLERAGGLTELAYPFGSVFSRQELREKEEVELRRLRERLQAEMAAVTVEQMQTDPRAQQSVSSAKTLLDQLETTEAIGRLVIDLPKVLAGEDQVAVRDGDRLIVPRKPQEVTVLGEVQQTTSHLYDDDLSRDDYIQRSGGLTPRANKGSIYVVRANGAVIASSASAWYRRGTQSIQPGDTIVVPLDVERMRPLTLWGTVADIASKLALTAASAKAVGVF